MLRDTPEECAIEDWVLMMEFEEWDPEGSPYTWQSPSGETWHFAFTDALVFTEEGEEAGTDFVWMRYDPDSWCPPPPRVPMFRLRPPQDPADRWKSE